MININKGRIRSALCAALCLCLCACAPAVAEDRLSIIATNFPAYDVARSIAGDAADVRMLLPAGGESHSFEPTPQDILDIQAADLFVYVGGESDAWVERALGSMGADAPETFTLMSCVRAAHEELSASMEEHEEHEEHDADEAELDEHVWTSPVNMMLIADAMCEKLSAIAPASEAAVRERLAAYTAELKALDASFREVVAQGKRDVIVFGDRFPLRYFADEYGLRYDAAFPGCSEDSEPSVRTVMSLVELVRSEGIPVIFYIEFSNRKTADIIAEETGAREMLFHSCHNVSSDELQSGETYLSLMRRNVDALREALD